MAECELNVRELTSNVTVAVTIKNVRQWAWRIKIACLLMRLAAWIAWMTIRFEP